MRVNGVGNDSDMMLCELKQFIQGACDELLLVMHRQSPQGTCAVRRPLATPQLAAITEEAECPGLGGRGTAVEPKGAKGQGGGKAEAPAAVVS